MDEKELKKMIENFTGAMDAMKEAFKLQNKVIELLIERISKMEDHNGN